MDFLKTLEAKPFMLYDGPMETRIQYGASIKLNDAMSIFHLIYDEEGQHALRSLYEKDIATTEHYHAPIILNAPTFRASSLHCAHHGFTDADSVEKINRDAINFVKAIRDKFGSHKYNIYITAPMGPRQYDKDSAFTMEKAEEYHAKQANAIATAGVDIISIVGMPETIEAIACAKAVAKAVADKNIPYSVGIMVNSEGTMLDGSSIKHLIDRLDNEVSPKPNFYILSCTHAISAKHALHDHDEIYQRILGIKANGSNKSAKELFQLDHPESDSPEIFADELVWLGKEFHFKIYGGCCGTDDRHLAALVRKLCENYSCQINT